MLQQTQVATVIDYFRRFVKRFPNVKALAAADESEVLKLWEGLGYYRRARQMHAAAKQVVQLHRGVFPKDFDSVIKLPGIGRYTAGAILSIALDQRLPILEGNTIRLYSRLMALRSDPRTSENQKRLWDFAESILPVRRAGDFNQALMELGSTICTPKNPDCLRCPLSGICPTYERGLQGEIPASGKRTEYEQLVEAVVILKRRGRYWVRLCQPGERWAGLWDFPRFRMDPSIADTVNRKAKKPSRPANRRAITANEGPDHSDDIIKDELTRQLKEQWEIDAVLQRCDLTIKHTVTRYRIHLSCFQADRFDGKPRCDSGECRWVTRAELNALPMNVTAREVVEWIRC